MLVGVGTTTNLHCKFVVVPTCRAWQKPALSEPFRRPRRTGWVKEVCSFTDDCFPHLEEMAAVPSEFNSSAAPGEELDEHIFDLANASRVKYREIISLQRCLDECSGGVVWESAHVLVRYFLEAPSIPLQSKPQTICELGAGCGLLGTALARYLAPRPTRVVLTEASAALEHLRVNVEQNESHRPPTTPKPEVRLLDWLDTSSGASLGTFDCIIGTDVLFSPELIKPLLATAAKLAHADSVVWLCAPRRCERAWSILEETLPLTFASAELVTPALHAAVPVAASLEVELWRCSGPLGKAKGGDHEYRPEEQVHKAKSKKRREEKKSKIKKKRKLQDARTQGGL